MPVNKKELAAGASIGKVLIVDSDTMMHKLISNYLSDLNHEGMVYATSNDDAKQIFTEQNYGLVVMDWKSVSKSASSAELLAFFRTQENGLDLPIILTCGGITKADIDEARKYKLTNFLAKPFTQELIMQIVSKTMGINTNVLFKKNRNVSHLSTVAGGANKKPEDSTFIMSGSKNQKNDGNQVNIIGKGTNQQAGSNNVVMKASNNMTREHPPAPSANDYKTAPQKDNGFSISASKGGAPLGSDMTMKASPRSANNSADTPITFKANPADSAMQQQKNFIARANPSDNPHGQPNAFNKRQDGSDNRSAAPPGSASQTNPNGMNARFSNNANAPGYSDGKSGAKGGPGQADGKAAAATIIGNAVGKPGVGAGVPRAPVGVNNPQGQNPQAAKAAAGASLNTTTENKVQSSTVGKTVDQNGNPISSAAAQALANTAAALPSNGDPASSLGGLIGSALIADSDPAIRNLLQSYLSKRQVKIIELCSEGVTADRILTERTFDLVVIDWRLSGVTGLSIYNRLRTRPETKNQKVLVLTGFISKEDFRILDESPLVSFVEKPLQLTPFTRVLDSLIKEEKEMINIQKMALNIAQQGKENPGIIDGFIAKIGAASNVPVKVILSVVDIFVKAKQKTFAEKLLFVALKIDAKHPVVLTELAKILFRTNRATEAMGLLKKAQSFSPQSVERLCLLGEVGLTLQQADEAKGYFRKVLEIDRNNVIATAGLTVSDNMVEHIAANPESELPLKLASSLNMIGVALARRKHLKNAVDQYKAALCFLYDDDDQAKLKFNLGMAHLRVGSTDEAIKWLSEADLMSGGKFEKAKIWKDKAIVYSQNKTLPGNTINYQFDDDYES